MVTSTTERFSEAATKSVDAVQEFIQTSLTSFEKIANLNIEISKKLIKNTSNTLKEISTLKTPKDLFDKVNHLTTQSIENNINNCCDLCKVITDTHSKMNKLLENQVNITRQNVSTVIENITKLSPSHTNSITTESLKNWVDGADKALDAISQMTSKVTEFTNSNIKAATDTTAKIVSTIKKSNNK